MSLTDLPLSKTLFQMIKQKELSWICKSSFDKFICYHKASGFGCAGTYLIKFGHLEKSGTWYPFHTRKCIKGFLRDPIETIHSVGSVGYPAQG